MIAELCRRGEYVKSAMSTIEAPVVRNILRDFAATSDKPVPDASIAPELYGSSADIGADDVSGKTFAEAVERIKAQSRHPGPASRLPGWRSPILQALLD